MNGVVDRRWAAVAFLVCVLAGACADARRGDAGVGPGAPSGGGADGGLGAPAASPDVAQASRHDAAPLPGDALAGSVPLDVPIASTVDVATPVADGGSREVAPPFDAPSVRDAGAGGGTDLVPRVVLDAGAFDLGLRPLPAGANCSFSACGGAPGGDWELLGYCSQDTGGSIVRTGGTLAMGPGRYTFTLLTAPPMTDQPIPPPQEGTYRVQGTSLRLQATSDAPSFPARGAFVRGAEGGAEAPFCVAGNLLRVFASSTHDFIWVFAR